MAAPPAVPGLAVVKSAVPHFLVGWLLGQMVEPLAFRAGVSLSRLEATSADRRSVFQKGMPSLNLRRPVM
jgi:hypothetical protein